MQYSEGYKKVIDESIEECYRLFKSDSIDNLIKLNSKLDLIISCSKLEDHLNICLLTEKIKYIVDSLVTGHKINSDIRSLVLKYLSTIKQDLTSQNHSLDLNLIDNIKNSYDQIKRNERDYIYTKRLNCLLITSDKFLCGIVLNAVDESINVIVSESYQKSFERAGTENFDVIMCDAMRIDPIIDDFISTFSKKIPIAIICRSNDMHLILNIARFGIKYVIMGDELGIKYLTKSLHAIYTEWIKERKKFSLKPVLENPDTRIIFRDMLLTELPIYQKIRCYFTNEIDVNPVIKESYNIKVNELVKSNSDLIDLLVKEKYLIKEKVKNYIICPNCKSVDLDISYGCHKCNDNLFAKYEEVITHDGCGYTGLKNIFTIGDKFYCPGCKVRFDDLDDCIKRSSYFCQNCLEYFEEPDLRYKCNFCDFGPFRHISGILKTIHKYEINSLLHKEFKKNFLILQKLSDYLIQVGYALSFNEKSTKNTTSDIFFDLIARKKDQMVIVIILSSDLEYNIELLYHIELLRKEQINFVPLVVSLDEPSQLIFNLLSKFNINMIISNNENEIFSRFKKYFQ
ncbi:hypothetical protein [Candidatus Nitrosocosmicus arcticus]|uniref:Thaumarchaeal output domain-containing protein n=1 Tax=Candidatus Nitrosocosmicus arcticus TaxID=2035267 RepID=A0A557SXA2_9ARCH|nr:hypothetical protein [Candidatus Nitrosocosmicus arcticus]TVP41238.1 hypothetical protein NARC_40201 [Candidatus Nitrosocosmicus arcticus]